MTEMNLTLSDMKAQINKNKKKNLTVSKAYKEKEKAAKKAAVKVTTDKKAKAVKVTKPAKEKAPKIDFVVQEVEIAKILKVALEETQVKGKTRKIGTRDSISLVSMPERKELAIKVKGTVVCEIYPRGTAIKICTREKFLNQVKLPEGIKAEHHEKWDMTESFNVPKDKMASMLNQFTKVSKEGGKQ